MPMLDPSGCDEILHLPLIAAEETMMGGRYYEYIASASSSAGLRGHRLPPVPGSCQADWTGPEAALYGYGQHELNCPCASGRFSRGHNGFKH